MQMKLGNSGMVMVTGVLRTDVKYDQMSNGNRRCSAGIVVGTRRDEQGKPLKDEHGHSISIWANITAWGGKADILKAARRGDSVLAIGTLSSWEKDGKSYKSLNLNDDGFLALSYPPEIVQGGQPQEPPAMEPIDEDDGELPF